VLNRRFIRARLGEGLSLRYLSAFARYLGGPDAVTPLSRGQAQARRAMTVFLNSDDSPLFPCVRIPLYSARELQLLRCKAPSEEHMNFDYSPRQRELMDSVQEFMDRHVYTAEKTYAAQMEEATRKGNRWIVVPIVEELKAKAKQQGLWNFFLPHSKWGPGLSNLEYAPLAEIMGRVSFASEVFNCSAPDTGNMEVLERYGSPAQQEKWLKPLLEGEIRSAFIMTEPAVASSDATNIATRIERKGDRYVINGRKWWSSGIGDPRCKILIVMGKTDTAADK
jgi:hypothetical protein